MTDSTPPKKKRDQIREELPEDLRPIFDQLVDEYKFYSFKIHGKEFVSYGILGELVKDGWRPVRD
jgi:hypothetical protein